MSNLCDSQDKFNHAIRQAIRDTSESQQPPVLRLLAMSIYVLLIIWALILAMKVSSPETRVVHFVLAIVFSPAYIIAHYLNTHFESSQ
jgi:hypothetical protein